MLVLYNLLQAVALIVVGPLLAVKAILTAKYRRRLPQRLGKGLAAAMAGCRPGAPRIWIHALSVGEVASARALVKALRTELPEADLVLSTSTAAGGDYARAVLAAEIDVFLTFPFDILPCVARFLDLVRPDIFLQVETDFWPNFLHGLRRRGVPAVLVNGRISDRSFQGYQRARLLFRPLFNAFAMICMQTEQDVARMVDLGVPAVKVVTLGNLKYESVLPAKAEGKSAPGTYGIAVDQMLWVAGSTHDGEHEMALRVHKRLLGLYPRLLLVLAPRQVDRGERLAGLAIDEELAAVRRSRGGAAGGATVLILDTIGELADLYRFCVAAFVGGSLVAAGGHNPLEPAVFAKPVLFGPHMDDFREVSRDLLASGGAVMVGDEEELFHELQGLLADAALRRHRGELAGCFVTRQQGVTVRHLDLVKRLLAQRREGAG